MELLWDIIECYRSITGSYRAIANVLECYRTLQSVAGCYKTLRKHCGSLQNITGALWSRYGTVTENINFAHH